MNKIILLLFLLIISSCGKESDSKIINPTNPTNGNDDSIISGVVTQIWNQLIISQAHAIARGEGVEVGGDPGGRVTVTPEEVYSEMSSTILTNDFISSSTSTTYSDILTDALSYADYTVGLISNYVTASDFAVLSESDFPHGIVLAVGYDHHKKIISIIHAALSADGRYALKDTKSNDVMFYKMSFLFTKSGQVEYRQSIVFTEGVPVKNDVDIVKSSVGLKVSEEIALSIDAISADTIKSKLNAYTLEVRNAPTATSDEINSARVYLNAGHADYVSLPPIQRSLMEASMINKMKIDPVLRTAIVSSRVELASVESGRLAEHSISLSGAAATKLYAAIDAVVSALQSVGFISRTVNSADSRNGQSSGEVQYASREGSVESSGGRGGQAGEVMVPE